MKDCIINWYCNQLINDSSLTIETNKEQEGTKPRLKNDIPFLCIVRISYIIITVFSHSFINTDSKVYSDIIHYFYRVLLHGRKQFQA